LISATPGTVPGMNETTQVRYALGWDNGLVHPLSTDEARGRDEAGEPYVVVLHQDAVVTAVLKIAWKARRLSLDVLAPSGGRTQAGDLRLDHDGSVFVLRHRWWDEPADGPFQEPSIEAELWRGGGGKNTFRRKDGGMLQQWTDDVRPRFPRPLFGQWGRVLGHFGARAPEQSGVADGRLPVSDGEQWTLAGPFAPGDVDSLFTPGAVVRYDDADATVTVIDAGNLALPTGRLAAGDPGYLTGGPTLETIDVEIPPGTYPVSVSVVTVHRGWQVVAAARVQISDAPVVSWQMGLRAGEHLVDLLDGSFYGFGVDTGTASFLDESAAERVKDTIDDALANLDDLSSSVAEDVVFWHSGHGDGVYPVWVGYDENDDIAALVADMLVVDRPGS